MTWALYRWVWRLEAPLFIGMPPAGTLNRCRMYVPVRPVWGALTAEIARLQTADDGFPGYLEVGNRLKGKTRMSYLYPAEKTSRDYRVWLPEFREEAGLLWCSKNGAAWDKSICPDRSFRNRLLYARPGTAIEPMSDSAFEGSLRETECIQPFWKDKKDGSLSPVYLVGYLMTSESESVLSQIIEVERVFIGGDTRYGLGNVRRIALDKAEDVFGAKIILDGKDPIIESNQILSHADIQNQVQLRGALEAIAGWDNTSNSRLHTIGGGPFWVPGAMIKAKGKNSRWIIDFAGFWSFAGYA